MENINLCSEVLKTAQKLNLKQSGLDYLKNHKTFIEAFDKEDSFQKVMLTTLLYGLLVSSSFIPPSKIRIALNSGMTSLSWLDDIRLTVLPFIKENEDHYFPN